MRTKTKDKYCHNSSIMHFEDYRPYTSSVAKTSFIPTEIICAEWRIRADGIRLISANGIRQKVNNALLDQLSQFFIIFTDKETKCLS